MATRPAFLRTVSLPVRDRPDGHPFDVPAIASLDEIAFAPVTVFVGDNGSGKSTLIEAIALASGSFLDLMEQRFVGPGLFIMDEPESALSFHGQLRLMALMADGLAAGSQVVIATHSPLLMADPGARILSFDDDVIREASYDELPVVVLWRRFLDVPDHFLAALLDVPEQRDR